MPTYDIWVLGEGDVTISGGGQLDGVTQGDGSHLVGRTLTLNSTNWSAISVNDDDTSFADNDSGQQLNGAQVVDGVTYVNGSVVEAEYAFNVTDGTNTYTLVAFNVQNSSPSYATVEGIAFIGDPGGWPPVGVPLTVVSAQEGPSYAADAYVEPVCFAAGTLIDTPDGPRRVELFKPGHRVRTINGRKATVRWVGQRRYRTHEGNRPIRFRAGAIGNTRDLIVSPQHRILVRDWRVSLLFGLTGALVAAQDFVNGSNVVFEDVEVITYVHLLFDRHEIILSEGAPTESLYPGPCALNNLAPSARAELLSVFPELGHHSHVAPPVAPTLKSHEARLLLAA
ncbi:Hint domain-containing protein [Antarctobacter sp.]|uniref:Hint domain-containing protein n=1 Tax=Antarctobacter sp. TaxID=1872577 RepID=UPI003A8ED80E